MHLRELFQSAGLFLPTGSNLVWLIADTDELGTVYPAVDAALRQRPAYRLVIAVPRPQLLKARRLLPHELIVVQPSRHGWKGSSWVGRSALQILGTRYHYLAQSAGNSLKIGETLDPTQVLCRIPDTPFIARAPGGRTFQKLLIKVLAGAAIGQLDVLARRLGSPNHILCLGNGPSSEDPRLDDLSYDSLFRVNWVWRERGLHLNPGLVLTADPDFPTGSPAPIIGFPTEPVGLPILIRHCLAFHRPRRGYLFAEALLPALGIDGGALIPSNGAIMIAVAAALKPERLTIAGIDLYVHDRGRYPGDTRAVDGYGRQHSRATDLEFIRTALATYEGRLKILSESLRQELNGAKA